MTGEDVGFDRHNMGERDIREGGARADSDSFTDRLLTYDERWAGQKDKDELARAGFTYTGIGDKVECEYCGLKLLNWTSTDDPLHEHAKRRPLCPFINTRYRQLGKPKPPKHPEYQELQSRLDSFVAWPSRYVPKTPEELAAAGFFYIGSADRVTCFQCGITLRDWEEDHDPVTEHQRYSENCQFINKTDINQLGVTTRTVDNNSNHGDDQSIGACGGETTVSGQVSKKSNIASCQTTEDDVLTSGSFSSTPTSTEVNSTPISVETRDANTVVSQQCPERENNPASAVPSEASGINNNTSHQMTAKLAEENRRLKQRRTCKVCQNATVFILFLPCGHLVTCDDCAPKVTDCVVCGKTILGTVKTYFT